MIDQFAQIVGLLSAFSSSRASTKALDFSEFQHWLSHHNHKDILEGLESNAKTAIFVKAYLNQQLPEIQGKLDHVIDLVNAMASAVIGESQQGEVVFSGRHYLKGVTLLGLETVIHSNLQSEGFKFAHAYMLEMIGDDVQYNEYVLDRMVRESLLRNCTATEIISKHWLELITYS
ncbi:MAG: hypothetical protein ACJAY7_000063 [Pseudohongiellaceae bacterium]|jgi:hypothetical protein|tara:strand:- start:190 stop:714 length:525 start_codon:yes stop_codon:yes gene_type:complete